MSLCQRLSTLSPRFLLILSVLFVGMVGLVGIQLDAYRDSMMKERQLKTRALVESVHSLIEFYRDKSAKEGLSEDDAKKYAIQAIRSINNNEKEYFWIIDTRGFMVMHAQEPELEGRDMTSTLDADGHPLFLEMIKIAKNKGAGFLTYKWAKPSETGGRVFSKLSYVESFEPWQWIVGSGIYVDDVDTAFWNAVFIAGAMSIAVLLFCVALALTASESMKKT